MESQLCSFSITFISITLPNVIEIFVTFDLVRFHHQYISLKPEAERIEDRGDFPRVSSIFLLSIRPTSFPRTTASESPGRSSSVTLFL